VGVGTVEIEPDELHGTFALEGLAIR
jgi:hypothetical protein